MRQKILGVALALGFCVTSAWAQKINPVWEFLITGENSKIPILKKNEPAPNETWDGTDIYDSYGGLKRYDANRLLLAVRENGINETDPNHDAALAAQFPDRSLIWINPADGSPMGVALVIGLKPVPLDPDFLAAGGSDIDYYFTFGVADDGVIYTGYKNKILRYEPDGQGGFKAPTVAYTHENDGSPYWSAWRYETMQVMGSGADTVILAGGKTWRDKQYYYWFETEDGKTFNWFNEIPFKGGASRPFLSPDGANVYVVGGDYPGGASGFGINIRRYFFAAGTLDPFEQDPDFAFTAPAIDLENQNYLNTYIGWFTTGYAGYDRWPYFAVYSTPSWDTKHSETSGALGFAANPMDTPYLPGWLALHDAATGAYIDGSARMLTVTEADELDGDTVGTEQPASRWHGTLGDLQINVLGTGDNAQVELLWNGGIYGIGRYILGEPTRVSDWSLF
ncbi:MAG TPA: hypothetical protein PK878_07105 [bacterium]|nr:hypothetical protein [Candidatus Omnitrophota bacterium]HOJ60040.1 hypothetical protein [bacterium]HOL92992.1 hypothetical protein [bacterium]HPO99344.1 hypothetical protein [bacterium]HXK92344.1 hypothetical protein [bacterium]